MAHYTQNLNLFEKDPAVDGKTKFSVTTMLNENWDKIDTGVQKKLTAGDNIIIEDDVISAIISEVVQNITPVSSNTISLLNNKGIYSKTIASNTTLTFDVSELGTLTNKAVTFEFFMTRTSGTITFPNNITWIEEPDLTETGKYLFVFKTFDGGTTWLGNLEAKW